LKSFREIGHRDNELAALSNLGAAYTDMRDFKAAENHLRQVVNLSDGKDWWGLRDTFINLAEVTFAQSNLAEATLTAQRALTEGIKADDKNVMGKAWFILAQTSARLGMYMEIDGKNVTADGCFERAANCFADDNAEKARIIEKWAIFEDDFGDATKARTLFRQAVGLYTGLSMTEDADRIKRDRLGEA
jgi:tetratricopeptide (TPR) repeat protein